MTNHPRALLRCMIDPFHFFSNTYICTPEKNTAINFTVRLVMNTRTRKSIFIGLLLIIIHVLPMSTMGQPDSKAPFQVKWGKTFEDARRSFLQDMVGYDKNGFYVLTGKSREGDPTDGTFQIQYFNHDLTLQRSQPVELKTGGRYEVLEDLVQLDETIYVFTSQADPKTKTHTMYVRKLNKSTLLAEPAGRKIAEVQIIKNKELTYRPFAIRRSRDRSHVMIFYSLPDKKGELDEFGVHIFDNQLNEVWKKDLTMPYPDELFSVLSRRVGNDGKVYLLGKYEKDRTGSKRHGKPNYEYKIFVYERGADPKEYPVTSEERFLMDMQIGILDNGDIACAGFYSDEGLKSIRGTFFLRIDGTTAKITTSTFKEFDTDFLTQNMSERKAERLKKKEEKGKDVEIRDFTLDDLVMRSDGGVILLAEERYTITTTQTMNIAGTPSTFTTKTHHFGDIIAVNINPDGVIDWSLILPKHQSTTSVGIFYFSYSLAVVGETLYVIYNDDPQNITFKMPGSPKVLSGMESSIIMVNQISNNGVVKRFPIFSSFGADVSFWPNLSVQVSPHEMIFFAKRKRDQQFIRITFDQ